MSGFRLDRGGLIDRGRPLRFTFDGRGMTGFAGDTLASALLANGVRVVGRSFKYHRPRGVFATGADEPNALVQLGEGARAEPNRKATQVELTEGLVARSVNVWPSADFDLMAVNDRLSALLPAGFYYKTFLWPDWHAFEGPIRRAAGLGVAPADPDPDRYAHRSLACDLLVVGAGPAGLAAALAGVATGAQVVLVDEDATPGGCLLGTAAVVDGLPADRWIAQAMALLRAAGATLLTRTTAFGLYDHRLVGAVEQLGEGAAPRERYWKLRAGRIVLATGAHERPLVFPGNDRPGVMLASAAARYVQRHGVAPGRRAVVFATDDAGHASARVLSDAGIEVAAVVDPREAAAESDPVVLAGHVVDGVAGRRSVRGVTVRRLADGATRRIACDLLCVAGGWSPVVHLFSQGGGRLAFCAERQMFVPAAPLDGIAVAGGANGSLGLDAALAEGWSAGAGERTSSGPAPRAATDAPRRPTAPLPEPNMSGKAFVDLANDVTAADVALAARENYVSVEHLKRYTTLGMGVDQGKTSNVNGIALLGKRTGRSAGEVGTTRFRPPYSPISLGAIAGPYRGDLARPRRLLPAYDWHVARDAAFDEYSGWQRPAAYPRAGESIEAAAAREALAVRNAVGLFDGSPLGKIELSGPDAGLFLDRIYVGVASTLGVGRARYGLMLNENGVIVDDGVFVRLAEERFLVHTTSGGAERIALAMEEWLQCEWVDLRVVVVDVTQQWANLTLSGPRARDLLASLGTDIDLAPVAFPHMAVREGRVAGVPTRVVRASFTGELSYEINVPAGTMPALLAATEAAGVAHGLVPYGVEALMILRTEKGYLHVGVDTDGTTLPDDVGRAGGVARKASDFVGRRSLSRPEAVRAGRLQFVGLAAADGRSLLPVGAHVLGGAAPPCPSDGFVTSSCLSPALGRPVALGLVRDGRARLGQQVTLHDLGRRYEARIVEPAFLDPDGERLRG